MIWLAYICPIIVSFGKILILENLSCNTSSTFPKCIVLADFDFGAQLSLHDCLHIFLLAHRWRKILLIFILRSRYVRHMERTEQIPHELINTAIGLWSNNHSSVSLAHVTRPAAGQIMCAEVCRRVDCSRGIWCFALGKLWSAWALYRFLILINVV